MAQGFRGAARRQLFPRWRVSTCCFCCPLGLPPNPPSCSPPAHPPSPGRQARGRGGAAQPLAAAPARPRSGARGAVGVGGGWGTRQLRVGRRRGFGVRLGLVLPGWRQQPRPQQPNYSSSSSSGGSSSLAGAAAPSPPSPTPPIKVVPRNILMIGPTGCGKTEIARRLARWVGLLGGGARAAAAGAGAGQGALGERSPPTGGAATKAPTPLQQSTPPIPCHPPSQAAPLPPPPRRLVDPPPPHPLPPPPKAC
jgi:hypothetical protein